MLYFIWGEEFEVLELRDGLWSAYILAEKVEDIGHGTTPKEAVISLFQHMLWKYG